MFMFRTKILGLLLMALVLGACTPDIAVPATVPPTRTVRATETGTAVAEIPVTVVQTATTPTATASTTRDLTQTTDSQNMIREEYANWAIDTPTPSNRATPTPGPPFAYWYSQNGNVYRYNFQNWTAEDMSSVNPSLTEKATISSNGLWLAYRTTDGLYYTNLTNGETTLLSEVDGEFGPDFFVFSPDGQMLAFRDNVGVQTVDLSTDLLTSAWQHDLDGRYDEWPDITIYDPLSWSPDQNWLLLRVGVWENSWLAIGSLPSKEIYTISGCYATDWSPNAVEFAMVVRYDSYVVCGGENDGVYVVSLADGAPFEQRIYTDPTFAPSKGLNGAASVAWSPDNQWITFVRESEIAPQAQLLLTTPDGSEIKVLAEVANGRILTPIWSPDSNTIYYVAVESSGSYSVYEIGLTSLETREIYKVSEDDRLLDISPDGQWLVLGASYYHDNYTNYTNQTTMLNVATGETVKIGSGSTNTKIFLIGWQQLE